jgi:ATP synthase protein I
MTTDTSADTRKARPYGVAALGVAVLAGSVSGVLVAVIAAVFDGSPGLVGGLAGAGVTLLVLATGFATVDLVAGLMPTMSLIVALMTYTLQVVLLAALMVVLRGADDIGSTLTPGWFAAGVITVAMSWTVCLVVHAMRARIPLYDLPERPSATAPPTGLVTPAVASPERSER